MLISLLILQLIILQVLNQTHQQVLAAMALSDYSIIPLVQEEVRACLQGVCGERVKEWRVEPLVTIEGRQFFNAQIILCETEQCTQFKQVFSQKSATFKEEIRFHSVGIR